jgi:hypothetical protein
MMKAGRKPRQVGRKDEILLLINPKKYCHIAQLLIIRTLDTLKLYRTANQKKYTIQQLHLVINRKQQSNLINIIQ